MGEARNNGYVAVWGSDSYGFVINASDAATLTVEAGGFLQAKGSGSTAFFAVSSNTTIQNSGTITGDIAAFGHPVLTNQASGLLIPMSQILLVNGSLTNYGTIDLTQGNDPIQIVGDLQNQAPVASSPPPTTLPARPPS